MRYRRTAAMLAAGAMVAACGRQAADPAIESPALADLPLVVQMEGTCEDVALTPYCWKQLKDPAGCYFLADNSDYKLGTVAWSGKCPDGVAQGPGELTYISDYEYPYDWIQKGLMAGGRKHGEWIENSPWGRVTEATYENGIRNGKRLIRNPAGIVLWDYHYVDGKRNGPFVLLSEHGTLLVRSNYRDDRLHGDYVRYSALDGALLAMGAYVNGEREGQWLESYAGFTLEGAYAGGLRDGPWVVRHKDGATLAEGSYLNDEPRGLWTFRYGDGSTSQGAYLGGKRVGVWTVNTPDGQSSTLNYARSAKARVLDGVPLIVRVEGRCGDLPLGFPCWKELSSPGECYWWNTGLELDPYLSESRLTWSGDCAHGLAEGEGTLILEAPPKPTWEASRRFSEGRHASIGKSTEVSPSSFRMTPDGMEAFMQRPVKRGHKGSLIAGRKSGVWKSTRRRADGVVDHYVNGVHTRSFSENRRGVVTYEYNYADGDANGVHALRSEDGTLKRSGTFVDWEKEGHWIEPSFAPRGLTLEGAYTNDQRQGEWTSSDKTGHVISRGPFLNDLPHGEWTYRYRNGFTAEGAYEHGKRTGPWAVHDREGKVTTVDYKHAEQ